MTKHIRFWYCRKCHKTLTRDKFSAKFLDARTPCDNCLRGQDNSLMDAQEGTAQPVYVRVRRVVKTPGNHNRDKD